MWLTEKDPDEEGRYFPPVNTNQISAILIGKNKNDGDKITTHYIQFVLPENKFTSWVKWNFDKKENRDEYFNKICEKLPKVDLGLTEVSL